MRLADLRVLSRRRDRVDGERPPALKAVAAAVVSILIAVWASPARASDDPETTVDAFHAALQAGDRERALSLLADDVVIFESGEAEMSRDEYASHHLAADMEFAAVTATEKIDRRARVAGDAAWVLTRFRITGRFRDRPVDTGSVETMLLRRTGDAWRVVHVHWSSRPR